MSGNARGAGRSRTLPRVLVDRISSLKVAWARRRAVREMESIPFDIRKDIGWRSGC